MLVNGKKYKVVSDINATVVYPDIYRVQGIARMVSLEGPRGAVFMLNLTDDPSVGFLVNHKWQTVARNPVWSVAA